MPQPEPSPAQQRNQGTAAVAMQGRPAAWIRDHLDAVYRYARRRLSHSDAEDVAQQSFEALFRAEAEDRAAEDPGAYLFGVARRRVADIHRRRLRRPEPVGLPEGWEAIDVAALPEETVASEELRDLVQIALGLLPGPEAFVLRRRYRQGESVADIAAALGVTPKAVEMRLRRGRAAFLRHFKRVGRDWMAESEAPQ